VYAKRFNPYFENEILREPQNYPLSMFDASFESPKFSTAFSNPFPLQSPFHSLDCPSVFLLLLLLLQVAIVELPFGFVSSDDIGGAGGTCVIRGCVPKKLLVYASEFKEAFEDARGFGWESAVPRHDLPSLIQRKATEIERLNKVYKTILEKSGVHMFGERIRDDSFTTHLMHVSMIRGQPACMFANQAPTRIALCRTFPSTILFFIYKYIPNKQCSHLEISNETPTFF
jgi:hypothetical protein